MKKYTGTHLYINISNFNEIVLDEQTRTTKITHSLHALNTYFSAIEYYVKEHFHESVVIEKITGSRLHMYICEDSASSFIILRSISCYSYRLCKILNKNFSAYKTLLDLKIQIGACYGKFYDFVFTGKDFEEETTIGFAANYAAKLQALGNDDTLSISESLYENIDDSDKDRFEKVYNSVITKYGQKFYFTTDISSIGTTFNFTSDYKKAYEIAHQINLKDIAQRSANKKVSPNELSVTECKTVYGIPLFADVRGFTQKFNDDDSNLEEMAKLTQEILTSMYSIIKIKGVHIQFQGDREFAVYHNYGDYNCVKDAVLDAMRLIDAIGCYGVSVGVGESIGTLFLSRIGARSEKDNIVIGKTTIEADRNEDIFAKENWVVISNEIFKELKDISKELAEQFHKMDNYYYTDLSYQKYSEIVRKKDLLKKTESRTYNGAWKKEI